MYVHATCTGLNYKHHGKSNNNFQPVDYNVYILLCKTLNRIYRGEGAYQRGSIFHLGLSMLASSYTEPTKKLPVHVQLAEPQKGGH